jgi:PAS domain S-box-containing protein
MKREQVLAILHEMAIVIGGEIHLQPLLTKTLQRFLFHTSFPCGMIFLETEEQRVTEYCLPLAEVILAQSIGDFELAGFNGAAVRVPTALIQGASALGEDPGLLNALPCRKDYYKAYLKLPIDDCGVILLLSPRMPSTDLPLTRIFQPVLNNLSKSILLCRSNEAYTQRIISDRSLAEAALRDLSYQNRLILDSVGEGICGLDRAGNASFVNPAAAKMLGYDPGELAGRPLHDIIHHRQDDSGAVPAEQCPITLTIRDGVPHRVPEDFFKKKDGSVFPVEYVATPLHDDEKIVGAVVVFQDISERRTAVAEIRQLASIVESSDDAIIGKTLDGVILSWNKGAEEIYGYRADEIKGQPISLLVPPDHPDEVPQILEKVRRGEHMDRYETPRVRKDGRNIYVSLTVSPVKDSTGRIVGASTIARDITKQKEAEEKLRRANTYNRSLIEASLDPLVTIGPDGTITDVNTATEKVTGCQRSELIGTDFSDYFTEPGMARDGYQQVFREGSVRDYPLGLRHRDGRITPVLYNASLYRDEAGKVIGVFAAARDMTARRKLEEQLRQSQKMEAVGQLAGGIAHDFNNILSAIVGYGSLLQMKMSPSDPMRLNLDQVLESANRAAALTRSLLAFSRKQVINPVPVNLNEIIRRIDKFLRRIIGEDIDLTTTCTADTLNINADSGQIEQVLMNLATNARDAMLRGGTLSISTEAVIIDDAFRKAHGYGKPGPYAMLAVSDTGTGMDEATRSKIFEPFFTTKELGKGTGLGLSIVYGIVKQHYGYINVYSESGRGTTFRIYLPLILAKEEAREQIAEAAPPTGGRETILVAEDDAVVGELTRTVLQEFGYRAILAEDGEDALRKFAENKDAIRLCILDMIMPKKRGKEVFDEIKKIDPGAKILFTSGYTADRMKMEGILEPGFDYILKPASPTALLKKVREILDR